MGGESVPCLGTGQRKANCIYVGEFLTTRRQATSCHRAKRANSLANSLGNSQANSQANSLANSLANLLQRLSSMVVLLARLANSQANRLAKSRANRANDSRELKLGQLTSLGCDIDQSEFQREHVWGRNPEW